MRNTVALASHQLVIVFMLLFLISPFLVSCQSQQKGQGLNTEPTVVERAHEAQFDKISLQIRLKLELFEVKSAEKMLNSIDTNSLGEEDLREFNELSEQVSELKAISEEMVDLMEEVETP